MRNNVDRLPPDIDFQSSLVEQVRTYELMTPLFGGGVEKHTADPITTVRGPEVRGQLRFWWRATRGGRFGGDLAAMKEGEDAIWGAAAEAGARRAVPTVQIFVEIIDPGKPVSQVSVVRQGQTRMYDYGHPSSPYSYVGFPLRATHGEADDRAHRPAVVEGAKFRLHLLFDPTHGPDVEAALWGWEVFGGIGARTRRGFGALRCTHIGNRAVLPPRTAADARKFLDDGLRKHVTGSVWPTSVPHLAHDVRLRVVGAPQGEPKAWSDLFNALKRFRQRRFPGQQNRPGRSKWPEPNAIRSITGKGDRRHPVPANPLHKFPRAAFGLPIIFQFKDDGDPEQTSLEGAQGERLASPLIIRPIPCGDKGQAVGLAVILETPYFSSSRLGDPMWDVRLKDAPANPALGTPADPVVQAKLSTPAEARFDPLDGETDILQAFLDSL